MTLSYINIRKVPGRLLYSVRLEISNLSVEYKPQSKADFGGYEVPISLFGTLFPYLLFCP